MVTNIYPQKAKPDPIAESTDSKLTIEIGKVKGLAEGSKSKG